MNLFGKAKKQPPMATKDSIQKMRETLELLEKRERYLEKKIEGELETAKKNAAKNKKVAMMALKKKKTYENQMEKISGARMTIETQVLAIENANVNLEAMNAMQIGAQAMKKIHAGMTVDQVDKTMDDIRDQMDIANEISDAISQPVAMGGVEMDDDELERELEELAQEELDAKFLDVQAVPSSLPAVPTSEPAVAAKAKPAKAARDEDEDDFERLRAEMAL
eukprot:Opistho-1_new@107209